MARPGADDRNRSLLGRVASGASERMLEVVDPNLVLDYVDVDGLLEKVDINALLERVDVNALLDRVDVNQLMDRVDVDALLERVDMETLIERAGVPEIVAESTSHLTGSALDFFRRPLVGLDEIIFRGLNRLFRRDPNEFPQGPGELVDWVDEHQKTTKDGVKTGRYGGPLTRLLAVILDAVLISFGFTLLVAGAVFVVRLFAPEYQVPDGSGLIYGIGLVLWGFLYFWISYTVFGKTIGKTLFGLRVVSSDGHVVLRARQTFVRVLTYPLSFLFFGLGLLGVTFNPERAAWHDKFAKTAVVYDWGSRTASMPTPLSDFLERQGADV